MEENRNIRRDQWDVFLDNIQRLSEKKLDLEQSLFPKENRGNILSLLQEVLNQLRTEEVKGIIKDQHSELRREQNGDKISDWLEREIKIFNSCVDKDFSGRHKDPKLVDNRLSQGKTIKDSIDKLLKLPGWLKKILDILNELLSLIKGSP
jgi:hypothetical protein